MTQLSQDFISGFSNTAGFIPTGGILAKVQTLAEMTALVGTGDKSAIYVEDERAWYYFDKEATDAVSTVAPFEVLAPDNVTPPDPGRWLIQTAGAVDADVIVYDPTALEASGFWATPAPTRLDEAIDNLAQRRNQFNTPFFSASGSGISFSGAAGTWFEVTEFYFLGGDDIHIHEVFALLGFGGQMSVRMYRKSDGAVVAEALNTSPGVGPTAVQLTVNEANVPAGPDIMIIEIRKDSGGGGGPGAASAYIYDLMLEMHGV